MSKSADSSLRFVVLLHAVGPKFTRTAEAHLDWMLEQSGTDTLRTFSTPVVENWDQAFEIEAEAIADHRSRYLDFEGPIGDDRGSVRREIAGTLGMAECRDDLLSMDVVWSSAVQGNPGTLKHAHVRFQRISAREELGSCETWTVSFVPGLNETN